MNRHTFDIWGLKLGWLLLLVVLLTGCTVSDRKVEYVFEPAEHYDLVNVGEGLQLLWTFTTDEQIMNPVVIDHKRTVYFQTHKAVYAVDPQSGFLVWRLPIKNPLLDSLRNFITPWGDILLVPTDRERVLQGIDAAAGKVLWELPFYNYVSAHAGHPQMTDLVVDDDRAYILLSLSRGTAIIAVDPLTGEVLWKAPNDLANGLPGRLFQDDEDRFMYAYSGHAIWKLDKVDGHIISRIDALIKSSRQPTYAAGVAYTSGGPARAIDLETGEIIWSFSPKMCTNKQERTVFEPPILDGNVGYALTACEYMAQINLKNGSPLWVTAIPSTVQSFEPTENTGYAFTPFGELFEVDKANGAITLRLSLSPPEIDVTTYNHLASDGNLLILTPGNNQAFAFRLK